MNAKKLAELGRHKIFEKSDEARMSTIEFLNYLNEIEGLDFTYHVYKGNFRQYKGQKPFIYEVLTIWNKKRYRWEMDSRDFNVSLEQMILFFMLENLEDFANCKGRFGGENEGDRTN